MAHRVSISFYKDAGKQIEALVSTDNPLPVETVGGVVGSSIYTELKNHDGTPLEGYTTSQIMASPVIVDYNPPVNFQTLWLLVYTEPNPNIASHIVVTAKLADSPPFRVAEATVPAGTRMEIPIPGGHRDYRIYLGDPDINGTTFGNVYWKLYGG